jgi:eukaryotic-like serine/threonine-protein kinase
MSEAFKLAPHEWAALRALLDQALALPEAERAAWVDALDDAGHGNYKPRLRSLLANASATGSADLLRTLPKVETGQFAPPPPGSAAEAAGDRVGPYRLVRELGSGGMASVWLAERTDMLQGRQVALKLPHGAWRRAGLAERMAREREILATLEHRNIARLYDAGVAEDGQPYLALEYVQGERIDAWCEHKALGVRERLQLFQQVARAVAYAHAQLVVHRDLKPSNILVNESGDVKLLDFGIAKLLDQGVAQETELTQQAGRALTPDYAAPEQILGKPIGTAADVYALGVVLFELLAGQRPYQLKRDTRAALLGRGTSACRIASSSAAPEGRRKALRGDLDTIVLKALKREPGERYGTVAGLAEDIERFLQQRPVLAQPDSAWYQARKLVRRNRVAVGSGVLVGAALLVGSALSLWQAGVARREQLRAEQVKELVKNIFIEADPYGSSAKAPTVIEVLRQAEAKLAQQTDLAPATRVELLNTLSQSFIGLHQLDDAERLAQRALELAERQLPAQARESLIAQRQWANVLRMRGRSKEVPALLDRLVPALQRAGPALQGELLEALSNRVHVLIDLGRAAEAVPAAETALALARRLHAEGSSGVASHAVTLALALRFARRTDEALAAAHDAMRLVDAAYANRPRHPLPPQARMNLASALADAGEVPRGIQEMQSAIAMAAASAGQENPEIGYYYGNLALMQLEAGQPQAALASVDRARALVAEQVDRASTTYGVLLQRSGTAFLALRQTRAASHDLDAAARTLAVSLGVEHERTRDTRALLARALALGGEGALAQRLLAPLLAQAANLTHGAQMRLLEAAATTDRLVGSDHLTAAALRAVPAPTASHKRQYGGAARAATALGLLHLERGRLSDATAVLNSAQRWFGQAGTADSPDTMDMELGLGRLALQHKDVTRAIDHFRRVDGYWAATDPSHRAAGEAAAWLALGLAEHGDTAQAVTTAARARSALRSSVLAADAALLQRLQAGLRQSR